MGCKSLQVVNLTDNVEFVDVRAFRNCPGIDADVVTNPDAEIAADAFDPKPEPSLEEDTARVESETPATSAPSDAPNVEEINAPIPAETEPFSPAREYI